MRVIDYWIGLGGLTESQYLGTKDDLKEDRDIDSSVYGIFNVGNLGWRYMNMMREILLWNVWGACDCHRSIIEIVISLS